ncbi:Pleckstrin homology domain-containing protein [Xylaria bambusicola]|uniref:Pleckstrin homology domain-containing protein n=1 Tax=Xylaria bambusicola TaxID=326684 RepID=UPI002008A1EC|nr:Pleckstrin homology domain-containing protein [Xylaria bambusicola]KAI0505671.1 Pleckstrin homology domain-containing protein [Xylaria bambusicola]
MAEEQKPVAVPETTPAVAEPVVEPVAESKPAEDKPAEDTPAVETAAPAEETPAAAEEAKEEVKPIEAGTLEHKGAPANFPKNLLYAKNHFWFGSDSVEKEKLATYLKHEKASDVGHHVVSWAAETGKGLLFFGKDSDKTTPTGVIQLSEASEPATEGSHKFHFTAKGHKHTFKAPTTADRDNWVEQIKLKIAEAKELATTVTESETYKQTLESLKPAPAAKKEEKPAAAVAEAPKEDTPAEAAEEAKEAKEEEKEEAKEEKKEEKKEEPKRRSASRKRASIFGNFLGKKDEAKKETPAEDKPAEAEGTAAATETTPIEQIIEATEAEATAQPAEVAATDATPAPAEEVKDTKEAAKPAPTKRASLFSGLSFGKKKVESESVPSTPAKEDAPVATEAPVAETAPVIPAVETTEPLTAEVASPAEASTEAAEAAPATNGETKKEVKSDKRKSSLPFAFGKKEKASSDEEGEKKSTPFFSKLRQTVKKSKPAEKSAEKVAEETPAEDKPADNAEGASEPAAEVAADAKTEETKVEEPAPVSVLEETPVEKPAAAAPAPVTAAA